jgi:hypothetical protein
MGELAGATPAERAWTRDLAAKVLEAVRNDEESPQARHPDGDAMSDDLVMFSLSQEVVTLARELSEVVGAAIPGWEAGVADCIRQVKARQAHFELYRASEDCRSCDEDDLMLAHVAMRAHPATFAVLDEILVMLEAMLERGQYKAKSDLMEPP